MYSYKKKCKKGFYPEFKLAIVVLPKLYAL